MGINYWIQWLHARLTGGRLVWLQDFDGEVTLAIARTTPFGNLVARRCTGGYVKLSDDGSARHPRWMWADKGVRHGQD